MQLHFEKITEENRREAEQLTVASDQIHFIETVGECLSEADEQPLWRPVGIYDDETLIGFAMYGQFPGPDYGRVWLDRLLIHKDYQHKGYGKQAVLALIERLKEEYGCEQVYLSVYEENEQAVGLYQRIGFSFNGELDYNGEKVMVYDEKCRKR